MVAISFRPVALAAAALLACTAPAIAGEAPAAPPARPYAIPAGVPDYVRKAVESPDRTPAMKARDGLRKPAELLVLSGVKPGDKVVEFAAFGQYFTTMLSSIVGEKGSILMIDLPYTEARAGAPSRAFVESHPNARYLVTDYNTVELPDNVDVVFNVLYYHDLPINKIDAAALNAKIFRALKPGGVFFVVDHNAAPGSGMRDVEKLHRIDPAVIREQVQAAGFQLVEESRILANPDDDLSQPVSFAADKRGTTDQSVFKFVKPQR
jgi:predicted methyltransferase